MDRETRVFVIIFLCGLIGVLLAIALQMLNSAGILVDEFLSSSLTIREVQFCVVFLWIIIGIGLSASRR